MERIKSRKLWIAIAGAVYFALQGQSLEAMTIILGYLGVQGFVDGVGK